MMIVIDTETTGLNCYKGDEILQLTILREDGEILFNEFFKPKVKRYWSFAERIHNISPEMVKDKPHIEDRLEEIQKIIDESNGVIFYNAEFDIKFLEAAGLKLDKPIDDEMLNFSDYAHAGRWVRLTDAVAEFGYKWDVNAHNSLGDCQATLFLHKKLKEIESNSKILK